MRVSSLPVFALLLASVGTTARAADAIEANDQIIVTGQRQAYRGDFTLKETPQSIQLIDEQWIDNNGLTRLTDVLDLSASVARQNNFGGLWDAYAVRGFAGDEIFHQAIWSTASMAAAALVAPAMPPASSRWRC